MGNPILPTEHSYIVNVFVLQSEDFMVGIFRLLSFDILNVFSQDEWQSGCFSIFFTEISSDHINTLLSYDCLNNNFLFNLNSQCSKHAYLSTQLLLLAITIEHSYFVT